MFVTDSCKTESSDFMGVKSETSEEVDGVLLSQTAMI